MQVVEYLDTTGKSVFAAWFDRLDPQSAAKVTVALAAEFSNTAPISDPGIGCILDATGNSSWCCWQVARSDVSSKISKPHKRDGPNTDASRKEFRDGADKGFQGNR